MQNKHKIIRILIAIELILLALLLFGIVASCYFFGNENSFLMSYCYSKQVLNELAGLILEGSISWDCFIIFKQPFCLATDGGFRGAARYSFPFWTFF